MKISVFSAQPYDKHYLSEVNSSKFADNDFELVFHPVPLSSTTAALAQDSAAVCAFVNDDLSAPVLSTLASNGTKAILLRCAGFNNVDLDAARSHGLFVARVSAYSPEAVAEFAIALILALNRHTHKAYSRVREGNFSLAGLVGFTMRGKTAGVVGTGKIGVAAARILAGFGCRVLAFDPFQNDEFKAIGKYVELDELLSESDIVTLHCPLIPQTEHIINADTLGKMKPGAMLVNTSRGGLIDTSAVIETLKSRRLGALGLDVYERESGLFYADRSDEVIQDDIFQRLTTFPNVLVSGHQAFFTAEALSEIAEATLTNARDFATGKEGGPNQLVNGGKAGGERPPRP